jgi:hypothetical protein
LDGKVNRGKTYRLDEARLWAHQGMSRDQELEPGGVHLQRLLDALLDIAVVEWLLGKHRPLKRCLRRHLV